jgi:hypothetical protein
MTTFSEAKKAIETTPAKITAAEFYTLLDENPSIFKAWKTPLEITEPVYLQYSPITHLSPHLTFSGKDEKDRSATFKDCEALEIATGTFHNAVSFKRSGIKTIETLHILSSDYEGIAAHFLGCKQLQTLQGTYPGAVSASGSGISNIENVHIETPNSHGVYMFLYGCPNITQFGKWKSQRIAIEKWKLAEPLPTNTIPEKITANQLYALLNANPSIFKDWNTPLEITGEVELQNHPITHLSPLLTFKNEADFSYCPNLVCATGTFESTVFFNESEIQTIEELHIKGTDQYGRSASFYNCQNLEKAAGTFEGSANFNNSSIKTIENLKIRNPDKENFYADFFQCDNLKNLEGWDLSKPIEIERYKIEAEKERIEKETRSIQKFQKENKPKELPFL